MKVIFSIFAALLLAVGLNAQTPEKMSYQAVIRGTGGQLVVNQSIGMQISILQNNPVGAVVFSEIHNATTNANGLVSIVIGEGYTVSGNLADIDWGVGIYFIKVETDITGGTSYSLSTVSQLLSVPYALHAKMAESAKEVINEIDGDVTNELQILSISNDTVFLTNGGFVKLPAGFSGDYNDLVNKPTDVSAFANDVGYLTAEEDGSDTNEIQVLSIADNQLNLSNNGGSVSLSNYVDTIWKIQGNDISNTNNGNVGIGTSSPHPSSVLDVNSSNSGILIPRLGNLQRDSIVSPAAGLIIYNTDCNELQYYNGLEWINVISSSSIPSPISLAAEDVGCSSFTIRWVAIPGVSAYVVDVATDVSFLNPVMNFHNILVENASQLVITGVSENMDYYFRVRSKISDCLSGVSNIQMLTTLPQMPAAPVMEDAVDISSDALTATWSMIPNIEAYYFDLSTDVNFSTLLPGYNNLNVGTDTSLNVVGLTMSTTYYLRVRSANVCGISTNSNVVSATTITLYLWYRDADGDTWGNAGVTTWAATAPAGYVDRSGDCNDSNASINPNANEICDNKDNDCDGSTDEGSLCPTVPNATSACQSGTCVINCNFGYGNCDGISANGCEVDLRTSPTNCGACGMVCPPRQNATTVCNNGACGFTCNAGWFNLDMSSSNGCESNTPPAPGVLNASGITSTSFSANWNTVAGAAGYYLDVSTDPAFGSFVEIYNNLDVGNVTTYSVVGLSPSTNYYYRLRAYYATYSSANSLTISTATNP